ncbi:MAG: ATP-binding protein [Proteobacteria bacterium]|nr:ATP-binding protein [Pseudomonadota bacterium]
MDTTKVMGRFSGSLAVRIAAGVFFSIIIIEAAILIPSYLNFERDLLVRLEHVGRASITSAFKVQSHAREQDLPFFGKLITRKREVVGGAFYRTNGQFIGKFGINPEIKLRKNLDAVEVQRSPDGQWLDVMWPSKVTALPWTVVARLDARWIGTELESFLVRIAGLVVLISIVVCGATMLILHFLVLQRIKALCKWLLGLKFDSETPHSKFIIAAPKDEFGQMAWTLIGVVERTASQLSEIRHDRADLDQANRNLEKIIEQRTGELRLAKETAVLSNRAKTEFLAHMSHELRTPLNAILGFAEMIKGQVFGPLDNEKYTEYASDIINAGKNLTSTISNILDVSRVELSNMKIVGEDVDLRTLVKDCIEIAQENADSTKVIISTHIHNNINKLHADGPRLQQIILNLLSNAIKYTTEEGQIIVSSYLDDDKGVTLSVKDTGTGIAPEDIQKAMEPFGQVRETSELAHDGTGLGLFLSKRLTELHAGTLTVESKVGKGTTVTIHFPPERTIHSSK